MRRAAPGLALDPQRTSAPFSSCLTQNMDGDISQLVDMGASRAQACAALHKYKDVMQAAERFFDGEFENVSEDTLCPSPVASTSKPARKLQVCAQHDAWRTREGLTI